MYLLIRWQCGSIIFSCLLFGLCWIFTKSKSMNQKNGNGTFPSRIPQDTFENYTFPTAEFNALEDLYTATNGPLWYWTPTASRGKPWNFSTVVNPCTENWEGVGCVCMPVSNTCHTKALTLQAHNLTGYLPPTIGDFPYLLSLNLTDNNIMGEIPSTIGDLTSLVIFSVANNSLNSSIPSTIGQLTNLTTLLLSNNSLHGSIPNSFCYLSNLITISLNNNFLIGSIPSFCGQHWSQLQNFYIAENKLTGSIPLSSSSLHLSALSIESNRFTGLLPRFNFEQTPNLQYLALGENFFHGTIPSEYGELIKLKVLDIDANFLSGILPDTFDQLFNLETFNCSLNHLNGTLDVFFNSHRSTNSTLTLLSASYNQFSGNAFPVDDEIGDLFQDLVYYNGYNNQLLSGSFPNVAFGSSQFSYINLGANLISGTIPTWISSISHISYLYVDQNMISGTIPDELGKYTRQLLVLFLQNNYLTGTIPASLGYNPMFNEFKAQNNQLQGTIPDSLCSCLQLTVLVVNTNQLTGTIPACFANLMKLLTLDVSSNILTGKFPFNMFASNSSLNTVILSNNCFEQELPDVICQAPLLVNLVMNGMGTSERCHQQMFPGLPYFGAFINTNERPVMLPRCLFEMQTLIALYLASNHIIGTIPHDLVSPRQLNELSLASNALTGDIPSWIQEMRWNTLDLSSNKLTGLLESKFVAQDTDSYVALDVNRLSGEIPQALINLINITMLNGNMFQCNIIRSNLPHHDPIFAYYSCGSDAVNRSLYAWLVAIGLTCIAITFVTIWYSKIFLQDSRETDEIVKQFGIDDSSGLFHIYRSYKYFFSVIDEAYREWKKKKIHHVLEEVDANNAIFKMFALFLAVRRVFAYLAYLTIAILMPMYILLTFWFSTYKITYTWMTAGAFFSGEIPAIFLIFGFMLILWTVFYMFRTTVYKFSARKLQDKVFTGRALQRKQDSKVSKHTTESNERKSSISRFTLPRLTSYFKPFAPSISMREETFGGGSIFDDDDRSLSRQFSTSKLSETFTWAMNSARFDVWKNHLYAKYYNRSQFIHTVATFIFAIINFVAILSVNLAYVIYSRKLNQESFILVQISLSIFKISWNEVIVWRLYPRVNILCSKLVENVQLRSAWLLCKKTDRPLNEQQEEDDRSTVNSMNDSHEAMLHTEIYQYTTVELNFMVLTIICNNVLLPCIAAIFGSTHCLYNAFFASPPTADVELSTCQYFRIRDTVTASSSECLWYDHYEYSSSYHAPFYYRFECSATFSIKFASVYIYMFSFVGIILPLFTIFLQYLYSKYDPNDRYGSEKKLLTTYEKTVFQVIDYVLPLRWKPLTPTPPQDVNTFKLLSNERLVVRLSSYLAIFLVFGVLFPPLAAVTLIAIYSITYFEEFTMSRLLVESKALNYTWYQEKILKECEYVAESWFDTLKTILPFASLLYACVIFDTLGDSYGWKVAIGPSVFIFSLPWCFYFIERIKTRFACCRRISGFCKTLFFALFISKSDYESGEDGIDSNFRASPSPAPSLSTSMAELNVIHRDVSIVELASFCSYQQNNSEVSAHDAHTQ